MSVKIVVIICALVAMVAAVPAQTGAGFGAWGGLGGWGGAGSWGNPGGWGVAAGWGNAASSPWIPPWVAPAPWYSQWTPCSAVGKSCVDCSTKLVCTPIGGLQRACIDPTLPYCNLGECSATPSAGCQAPAVPRPAAVPA